MLLEVKRHQLSVETGCFVAKVVFKEDNEGGDLLKLKMNGSNMKAFMANLEPTCCYVVAMVTAVTVTNRDALKLEICASVFIWWPPIQLV